MTKTGYDFFEYDEIDSTNLEAKRFVAKKSSATKQVFLAKRQTAGRGRLGRSFFSPEETGLYMSLLLQIDEKLLDTDLITPAAGVAVCRTIDFFYDEKGKKANPQIKWVNDIYLNKKKVCGILTEGILNPKEGKISQVIIGIGVNLFEPKTGFPPEIENIAGFAFNKDFFKNPEETKYQFVAKLLENLEITLEKSQEKITMEEYKEQEEELIEYFNNGVIYNYQALDAYIEHIVDNVPLSKYFDEDGILKSEKVEEVKDTEIES
jgi:BirA family biotin operon repressor/biotin-[acetyl-CoA-carboxylase] ligase